jgi:hypothetical protein
MKALRLGLLVVATLLVSGAIHPVAASTPPCLSIDSPTFLEGVVAGTTLTFNALCCTQVVAAVPVPAFPAPWIWLCGGAILVLGAVLSRRVSRRAAPFAGLLLLGGVTSVARPAQGQSACASGPFQWQAQATAETFTGTGPTFSFTPTTGDEYVVTLTEPGQEPATPVYALVTLPPLAPCTRGRTVNCVQCPYAVNNPPSSQCSGTESYFVARDMALGNVTAAGPDNGANSCYACLARHSCLDTTALGVSTTECEDGAFGNNTMAYQCLSVLQCVTTSGGANGTCVNPLTNNEGIQGCYCGTLDPNACEITPTNPNGPCDNPMASAYGYAVSDGYDISFNLLNTNLAGGRAAKIFLCGYEYCEASCQF